MSRAELEREKADIKRELKLFDMVFLGRVGRPAAHGDKEVVRPLYGYYKYLRACLSHSSVKVVPEDAQEIPANNEKPE